MLYPWYPQNEWLSDEEYRNSPPKERIEEMFRRMNVKLAEQKYLQFYGDNRWYSNSQYGYEIGGPFDSQEAAEQFTLDYYLANMHLIDQ